MIKTKNQFTFLLVTRSSIDNVVNKFGLCCFQYLHYYCNFPYFFGGLLWEKTPSLLVLLNLFHGSFRTTYNDAHQKYTHPKFEW